MTEPTGPNHPSNDLPAHLPDYSVRGGLAGLDADFAAAADLADLYDATGDRLLDWAGTPARTIVDGDLLASAPYAPVSFAAIECALGLLTATPVGLPAQALRWEAQAFALRAAVRGLRLADHLVSEQLEHQRYLLAYGASYAVAWLPAQVGIELPRPGDDLGPLRAALEGDGGGGGLPADELEQWAMANPGRAEALIGSAGGLLEGAWDAGEGSFTPYGGRWRLGTVGDAAGAVSTWYDDGEPRVTTVSAAAVPAAGSAAALVARLRAVDALSATGRAGGDGTIEVQRVDDGGTTRYVVLLPGTDDMATLPWTQGDDARDMGTNLRSLGGESTVHTRGIEEAMRRAGITADDPVMLVGHSQGGMAAAQVAATGEFRVEHVLTLGSPLAQVEHLPAGVQVTSLENERDLVPLLDGAPNGAGVEHLTVRFDGGGEHAADAHALGVYERGAAVLDAAAGGAGSDPVVRQRIDAMRAQGFLEPTAEVTATTYRIAREVVP